MGEPGNPKRNWRRCTKGEEIDTGGGGWTSGLGSEGVRGKEGWDAGCQWVPMDASEC